MKPSVLLVTTDALEVRGGISTYLQHLLAHLPVAGFNVSVLTRDEAELYYRSAESSATERLPANLGQAIDSSDLVHLNGFWTEPLIFARRYRKPVVWTHHGYDTSCPIAYGYFEGKSCQFSPLQCTRCFKSSGTMRQIPRRFGMLPIRRIAGEIVQANVVPSNYLGTRLRLPRMRTIYLGVEDPSERYAPAEAYGSDLPTFVFIGRLTGMKGCDLILRAMHALRSRGITAKLDIIGNGDEEENLRRLSTELGLQNHARFLGAMPNADAIRHLNTASYRAMIAPSIWDEVLGIVALEAMAASVPVIASRVGGLAEAVGEAGLLVDRGSVPQLADAMARIATDALLAQKLSRDGRKRYEESFTIDRLIAQHRDLYSKVMDEAEFGHSSP